MRVLLCALLVMWLMCPVGLRAGPVPAALTAADFAVGLPGGVFNLTTDTREDLERITGQRFEFFDEFPDLGIAYDRLITDRANFFTDRDAPHIDQVDFKDGCLTARGIGMGTSLDDVFAAYGEPPGWINEHGYIRAEYEWQGEDAYYTLRLVIDAKQGAQTILLERGK